MRRARVTQAAALAAFALLLSFVIPSPDATSGRVAAQSCTFPPPPASLTAQVSGNTVTLSWQPVSGVTHYAVEVGSASMLEDITWMKAYTPNVTVTAPAGTFYVRVRASRECGTSHPSNEVTITVGGGTAPAPAPAPTPAPSPAPAPAPSTGGIWGVVDREVLGTCPADIHDRFVVDGGDGWLYRTWHPQSVTVNGISCTFAHEHGDDPRRMSNSEIAASPVRFGYIGRRMNHEEPHEGFKVFITVPGDVNDEGRRNRVFSRSVFHMGTGGPRRFGMQHHSAEIRLIHPEFGLKAFTQLMMDTGGVGAVCDPRTRGPVKDVVQLGSPCRLSSFYEIWGTTEAVRFQGREVYRSFATPAVFDPVTVFNPGNPGETVYAWDRRVDAILNFPGNDRSSFRGCDRESYAQPGYWYNGGGRTTYYTDAHGRELPSTDAGALKQEISASNSIGVAATNDGLTQFKMRVDYCSNWRALGYKN